MTVKEYIRTNRLYPTAALAIIEHYWPDCASLFPKKSARGRMERMLRKRLSGVKFPDVERLNVLDTMVVLNKMVKHDTCPSNKKNYFYDKKHRIMKYLYEQGRVTRVIDEGSCYLFEIDNGKYCFHQPKFYFDGIEAESGNEYVSSDDHIPFDNELFWRWEMQYHLCNNHIDRFIEEYE